MIITRKYIMKHRTPKKAWTRSQLIAIGAGWPAVKGWQKRVIGAEISDEDAAIFEEKKTAKQVRGDSRPSYAEMAKIINDQSKKIAELEKSGDY